MHAPVPDTARANATFARRLLAANAVYLLAVHGWAIGLPPFAADWRFLAGADSPAQPGAALLAAQHAIFGEWHAGFRLVSLFLLWACMATLFLLTRQLTQGPWWLGSLAATLFMANPAKTEAFAMLSGAGELLLALAALLTLAAHAQARRSGRAAWLIPAALLFAGLLAEARFLPFVLVIMLLECTVFRRESGKAAHLAPYLAIAAGWLILRGLPPMNLDPAASFLPLWLVLYPIGFLPETAGAHAESPLLAWASAGAAAALAALLLRKAWHAPLFFALAAPFLLRIGQGGQPVDPVHIEGGAVLVLPTAFFGLAAAALTQRMIQHPKWHRPLVLLTAALCVLFFGLQVRALWDWRQAGRETAAFQAKLTESIATEDGPAPFIDLRWRDRAPLALRDAAHAVLDPAAIDALATPPLHAPPGMDAALETVTPPWKIRVRGASPRAVAGAPYTLAAPGDRIVRTDAIIELIALDADEFTLLVTPATQDQPPPASE